jgi:hypothetical protein
MHEIIAPLEMLTISVIGQLGYGASSSTFYRCGDAEGVLKAGRHLARSKERFLLAVLSSAI